MRRVVTLIPQGCYEDHRQFTLVCSRQGSGSSQVLLPGNICNFEDPHKRRQLSPLGVTLVLTVSLGGQAVRGPSCAVHTVSCGLQLHVCPSTQPNLPVLGVFSCVSTRPPVTQAAGCWLMPPLCSLPSYLSLWSTWPREGWAQPALLVTCPSCALG